MNIALVLAVYHIDECREKRSHPEQNDELYHIGSLSFQVSSEAPLCEKQ